MELYIAIIVIIVIIFTVMMFICFMNVSLQGGVKTTYFNQDSLPEEFIDYVTTRLDQLKPELNKTKNLNEVSELLNQITLEPRFNKYNDVLDQWRSAIISFLKYDKRWAISPSFDPCLPLLEAITVYKTENGYVFKSIDYLTYGGYNAVFNVITQDDEPLILKVQFVKNNVPASYHALEKIMKDVEMKCPNFPDIRFGSWMINHNNSAGEIDCSWMIMKEYQEVNEEMLKNNMEEMEKITLAMLRIACELYKHDLVFNDWKYDNMLLDPESNVYVLGDTDFVIVDPADTDHIYFTDTPFGNYIGMYTEQRPQLGICKYNLHEPYRGKFNSFDVMIWTIRLCIEEYTARRDNIPDKLQQFINLVPSKWRSLKHININDIEQIIS